MHLATSTRTIWHKTDLCTNIHTQTRQGAMVLKGYTYDHFSGTKMFSTLFGRTNHIKMQLSTHMNIEAPNLFNVIMVYMVLKRNLAKKVSTMPICVLKYIILKLLLYQ